MIERAGAAELAAARWSGVIVPMITPLDADERLDVPAVRRLVEYLLAAGVQGLFILGSGGEGPALRPAVRHALAAATADVVAGRVPIVAGLLEPSTVRVLEELDALERLGIAGYVATTPYYYGGYGANDLLNHFRRVAAATDRPLLLYNIPQLTRVVLPVELVPELAAVPNIVGIKDSSGDWPAFQQLLAGRSRPDFAILQGQQGLCAASLLAGADGLVPGYANVYPQLLVDLDRAGRQGDVAGAHAKQQQLDTLLQACGRVKLHAQKVLAAAMGLIQDRQASPLPRLSGDEQAAVITASIAAGLPLPGKPAAPHPVAPLAAASAAAE